MKPFIVLLVLCVFCNVANAQYSAAAGGGGVAAYPPYPPYPPPVYPQPAPQYPYPFPGGGGGGHGDPSRTYESALISLLAIQNVIQQQTEVQRGWSDRNNDKLGILLSQQEIFRQTYGRDQMELARALCGLQHIQQPYPIPYPIPRPIPPPRRRGIFFRGGGVTVGAESSAYYGY